MAEDLERSTASDPASSLSARSQTSSGLPFAIPAILTMALIGSLDTLRNSFTNWDDPGLVVENLQIRSLSLPHIIKIFTSLTDHAYLPIRTLSYTLDYAAWGLNPLGFHLTNVALHCANCILIFLLVSRIFRDSPRTESGWGEKIAFLAALFFAVHPAHVEAVAWVSGRKDLLATFFSLLAILSYCSPRWGALTAVFGACACLSKPTPFVLPLLVLIVEAVRENDGPRPIYERVRLIPFFSLVIVCVMLAGVHFAVGFSEGVIKTGQHVSEPRPVIIIAILAPLAEALRLLVFPVNLSPLYTFQGDQILPAIPPLSLLSTLGFVLLIIWCARTRDRVIAFGLLWLAVAYLPTCNLIPTSLPLAERYLYFPSLGFCICLARMFTASPRPRVSVSFSSLAALLVVLLCIGTWVNNARWRDSLSLWRWGAEVLPSCPEVWNDLATAYSQAGLLGRTRAALELSAATGWQRTPRLHLNRGLLLMKEGNYSAAVKDLLVAAEDAESAYKAHYHLGQAYEALTMSAEAIWEYKLAISLDPNAPAPHNNLGVIYERRRNLRTALKEYAIAIARDPSYALAYYNLGNLEMQQKHFASAETLYRKAIDLDPDHAMSHNNLAALLLDRGETQAAQEEFELAARLDPSLLQPILALAFIDAAQGRKDAALDKARRALQLDPKNVTALRLINKLER